jgi:NAD(P)-dependent dehydrogenase (short-subunit alcohol dehydrogenase family)
MTSLDGARCLITGAAGGIGRATAEAAARRGAELYLTDIQADALERAADAIEGAGGRVAYRKALDVTDHEAVLATAGEIQERHGSMDVVMNVAGIAIWGRIDDLEHEQWRRAVEVDLMGPIGVLEAFVPPMIEARRGGHIVNVSSAAGLLGLPWHGPYSAAKFGLRGVSEVLRFDLRRHGIGVSLVCPGAVRTPIVGAVEIAGVDRSDPAIAREIARFERHAVSPERAAERILRGVERNRYLVYTSADIRVLHWMQRLFEPAYALTMRLANDRFQRVLGRRRATPAGKPESPVS